jgi:hypothetical protein
MEFFIVALLLYIIFNLPSATKDDDEDRQPRARMHMHPGRLHQRGGNDGIKSYKNHTK